MYNKYINTTYINISLNNKHDIVVIVIISFPTWNTSRCRIQNQGSKKIKVGDVVFSPYAGQVLKVATVIKLLPESNSVNVKFEEYVMEDAFVMGDQLSVIVS